MKLPQIETRQGNRNCGNGEKTTGVLPLQEGWVDWMITWGLLLFLPLDLIHIYKRVVDSLFHKKF